jgi:hypothetical protein
MGRQVCHLEEGGDAATLFPLEDPVALHVREEQVPATGTRDDQSSSSSASALALGKLVQVRSTPSCTPKRACMLHKHPITLISHNPPPPPPPFSPPPRPHPSSRHTGPSKVVSPARVSCSTSSVTPPGISKDMASGSTATTAPNGGGLGRTRRGVGSGTEAEAAGGGKAVKEIS